MAFGNLIELLTDSFSPAIILPLAPGTAVSFLLPNCLEFVAVFFAIVAQRAVANPLNPAYTLDEVVFYLKDVEPVSSSCCALVGIPVYEVSLELVTKYSADRLPSQPLAQRRLSRLPTASVHAIQSEAIVTSRPVDGSLIDPLLDAHNKSAAAAARPAASSKPPAYSADDIALFLHTSGTTGRPKGVPLSHRNLLASTANIVDTYQMQASDASYLVMPLFHVHGLIGVLLSTLRSGGTVIVPPKFSVTRFWRDFIDLGATWYSAVPTIHQMLLLKADETYPGHSGALKFIRSCSSSLAPATMLELEKRFRAPVIEAYAMTEAAHQMTSNYLPRGMRKPGSVGKGRGVNVRILDDSGKALPLKAIGEVCVSGPNVFSGYHNNPKATAESFHFDAKRTPWFRTGDLGYLDEHKFVVLVGRIKEQINRGGEKISPVEIDQALLQHLDVAEAVVFGVPSALYGQEVEACVVLKKTASAKSVTSEVLCALVATKLAPFKIPKTATGKVQRRVVSDYFVSKAAKAKL
ncbi:hypothetical protein BC831DRAFT_435966 [Entophlyctis helioformis]|nr:hypothetical protein BC831DRAFT_435966 [Entophlyctis helioformis]